MGHTFREACGNNMTASALKAAALPAWVPDSVRLYLSHTEGGQSLRSLARSEGCHASTLLRMVRRFENRRDDPLVDEVLTRLGSASLFYKHDQPALSTHQKDDRAMTAALRADHLLTDEATITREARRILRRLCEAGALLIVAPDLEKAVVLRSQPDGGTIRTGVLDRAVAQAFALKDWIVRNINVEEDLAAIREIEETGGHKMEDIIREIEERMTPRE